MLDFVDLLLDELAARAGFEDAWSETTPGDPGFTCCHASDLRNPRPGARPAPRPRAAARDVEPVELDIVEDRTPSGVWPSDHAGVVATLEID